MLGDDSPEMKPSVEVKSEQQSAQFASSPTQTDRANQRLEMNNQERLQPNQTSNQGDSDKREIIKFGWENIEKGPLLPFIKRGSEHYVAWHIALQKVFRVILAVFSEKMLRCISLPVGKMSHAEAMAFNEINVDHCDLGLVGTHHFNYGDMMLPLGDVRKFVNYYYACRNAVVHGLLDNHLFGFIQVDEQTEVPFVWEGTQKFVPLFYFEGIDAKVINLKDPWKIGYFKFCFKSQMIREELYKDVPLKVFDLQDAEKFFSSGSIFKYCWPKKIDPSMFSSEMQTRLFQKNIPPTSIAKKRPSEAPTVTQAKQSRMEASSSHLTADLAANPAVVQPNRIQTTYQEHANTIGAIESQQVRTTNAVPIVQQYLEKKFQDFNDRVATRRLKQLVDGTNIQILPPAGSQMANDIRPVTSQQVTDSNELYLNAPEQGGEKNFRRYNNNFIPTRTHQFSGHTNASKPFPTINLHRNKSIEEDLITNVPRRSPQVATSPGIRQTSPFMMAATQPVETQGHSRNLGFSELPSDHQIYMSNQTYSVRPANTHEEQVYNNNHQRNSGTNEWNSLGRPVVPIRDDAHVQRQHFIPQNNLYDPMRSVNETPWSQGLTISTQIFSNSVGAHIQPCCEQVDPVSQIPNMPARNTSSNKANRTKLPGYPMNSNSVYQQSAHPVVQNVSVAVTNVVVSGNNGHSYLPTSTPSVITNKRRTNVQTEKKQLHFVIPEHVLNIDTYLETYTIKYCSIGKKKMLGIRMSLLSDSFLVNFREFAQLSLTTVELAKQYSLVTLFKVLYMLNHAQKELWDARCAKEKRRLFVGNLKDVFVDYNEVSVLLCLS